MSINEVKEKLSIVFRAVVLTSVILLSYFAGYSISAMFNFPNDYLSGIWAGVTAVVVFDDLPANSKNLVRDRLLGTFVGAIVGGLMVTLLKHSFLSIFLSLFAVCIIVTFFKWQGALKIACVTVLIVHFSTTNYSNMQIWVASAMRFLDGVVGGSISLFATLIIDKGRDMGFFLKKQEVAKTPD